MIQSASASSISFASTGFPALARTAAASVVGSLSPGAAGSAVALDAKSASPTMVSALTPQELQQVQQLEQIDRQVRAHEQAHIAVGADLVRGGATFSYQTGPDQQRYAVAGEVSIDASPAATPQETIPKAEHIRAAALAPADPSPQDHSVAAQASRMESEARMEVAALQREAAVGQGDAVLYQGGEPDRALGGRLDLFA